MDLATDSEMDEGLELVNLDDDDDTSASPIVTDDTKASALPLMSHRRMLGLSLFNFATNVFYAAFYALLLPDRIGLMRPQNKATVLGVTTSVGSVVGMIISPFIGAASDTHRSRWGRRTPFLFVGCLLTLVGIGMMAVAGGDLVLNLPFFIGAWCFCVFAINVATSPYQAVIPDNVNPSQYGVASGYFGLMTMLGNAIGVGVLGLLYHVFADAFNLDSGYVPAVLVTAIAMFVGMLVSVYMMKEAPLPPQVKKPKVGTPWMRAKAAVIKGASDFILPFRHKPFFWVFWTRLLMVAGLQSVQNFLQYWMKDVVVDFNFFDWFTLPDEQAATSMFLLPLLIGATIASLVAGVLSDRFGKKVVVYFAGALQALAAVGLIFLHTIEAAALLGFIFGLGYGGYNAVDFALASACLPDKQTAGRDMGIWGFALSIPNMLAPLVAGSVLDYFQNVGHHYHFVGLGYTVIFSMAVLFFVLSTVLTTRIKLDESSEQSDVQHIH